MSVESAGHERVVVSYVARTTSVRGTRFEVSHDERGFKPGVFDAQSIGTVPMARLVRRVGVIDRPTMAAVEQSVRAWLSL
jgi:mRNA interferase MazF